MVKVILNGCYGKMSQAIINIAKNFNNLEIVAGIDVKNRNDLPFPVFTNTNSVDVDADVIIDFSKPEALENIINLANNKKMALVVATTGLESHHREMLSKLSNTVPVLVSANMSVGVNLLINLVQKAAKVLEEQYDIEIIEKHHNLKLDAPSGTALMIADGINEVLKENKDYVYERQSKIQKREKKELGIHSIRAGSFVGEHSVIFSGLNEVLEINHFAYSRDIFANGSLNAAIFLSKKENGLYSMKDLFEF